MNDFSNLEAQLKAIRPMPLVNDFVARVEQAMANPEPAAQHPENIVRPVQFRRQWLVGLGLAAAASLLLLLRVDFRAPDTVKQFSSASPHATSAAQTPQSALPNTFIPAGSTQVVFHRRDEGLLFAKNSDQPVRRLRSITQETLQWRNPVTGASLQVSYPSEQVELIPVSGQ